MRKAYLDITELTEKEAISIFVGDDTEIILAGTTIYSMDVNLKKIIKNMLTIMIFNLYSTTVSQMQNFIQFPR